VRKQSDRVPAGCNNGATVVISGVAGSIKLPRGRQLDDWIIPQRRDRFQAHVATALDRPLIVLFEQQRARLRCDISVAAQRRIGM